MGLHGHERPLIALAPMTLRAADTAVTAILEALMGQRATVGRAAQRVEALGWPCACWLAPPPPGSRGGRGGGGSSAGALRWAEGGAHPNASGRLACGKEGRHCARQTGRKAWPGQRQRDWRGPPRVPSSAHAPARPQTGERAMGLERLGPGVPAPRGAALALQMLLTNLAERLTPRAQQPAQEGALVVQAEGLKGLRDRTHRMAGRRGKSRRVRLGHPRAVGHGCPVGQGRCRHALDA